MPTPHFSLARPNQSDSPVDGWLLKAYDVTIALLLFAAPLFMGGRHPAGRFVFVTLALAAAAIWCIKQTCGRARPWQHSALQWVLGIAVAWVLLQLVPLPEGLHRLISPYTSEVLPLWTTTAESSFQLGSWTTLSLAPYETRVGLLVFLAYAAVFLTACQRITKEQDIQQFLSLIGFAAFAMALLGIAQYLFGNGKFLWVYHHPFRDALSVQGPFVNRNHFVQFLAVGIGPLLYLVLRELNRDHGKKKPQRRFSTSETIRDRWQLYATGGMLLITLLAACLSLSRGGVLTVACVLTTCVLLSVWKKLLDRRALLVLGAAASMVLLALAIHGMGNLTDRLESLGTLSDDNSAHMRLIIWEANWQAIQKFPLAGVGAGAHTEVYPLFLSGDTRVEFTHAESGYLQIVTENGLIGLLLLLAGIAIVGRWAWLAVSKTKDPNRAALAVATIASLVAPLLHGAVDFVWWIPACVTPALLLLACLRCQASGTAKQAKRPQGSPAPAIGFQWQWGLAAIAALAVTVGGAMHLYGPARASHAWDQYLGISLATRSFRADAVARGATKLQGELDPESAETVNRMAKHLAEAIRHDPQNPRLNARLAAIRLRQFGLAQERSQNPMGLAMIRDAAFASQFKSRKEQFTWLKTALGDNLLLLRDALNCARRAVAGAPLQGEVYANLAELSFLESPRPQRKTALVQQALLARPHSGNVLLAAGREAAIAGNHERAIELFRQSFHAGRETQKLVIELIAAQTPVAEFVKTFDADLEAVRMLRDHYRELGIAPAVDEASAVIAELAHREAETSPSAAAAELYMEAGRMYFQLNRLDDATASAALAVRVAPMNFDARLYWAKCLMSVGDYKEAEKQWQWCLSRRPGDKYLRDQLAAAKHAELASAQQSLTR